MELLKSVIPTVPMINNGPELLVKASILSPSSLEHRLDSLKLVTIFAPTGYPLIIPRIKAYAAFPGTLNNGVINFAQILLNFSATFVYESNSVATKKGNRAGTTF